MEDKDQRSKLRNWIFIIVCGLIFLSGVIYWVYVKTLSLSDEFLSFSLRRMILAYWFIIRPLMAISAALFLLGLLSKAKILNLHAFGARGRRICLIAGAVLTGITLFYMLLLGVQATGLQYNRPESWLSQLITSSFYITLTKPFYLTNWESDALFVRDMVAFLGAALLYLAKSDEKSSEVINQQERKEELKL